MKGLIHSALALILGLAGILEPRHLLASEPSMAVRLPVTIDAPGKGFVSLGLYDKNDHLVRSLLYAEPVEKGGRVVQWDGTTDLGLPAKAGDFTARAIFFTQPPAIDYVMKVGKSGNPPWRTSDGAGDWGANLGHGTSIAANSKSLIMGWAAVEDNQITGVQQTDAEGNIQTRYFTFYPWDFRMAAAMDESSYYLGIYSFDKKTTEIAQYKLGEPRGKIFATLPVKAIPLKSGRWKGRETSNLDGLALTADALFASVAHENALFIIDRTTGAIRKRVEIADPHGLAVLGDRLLVVSGVRILALDFEGIVQRTLVKEGLLTAPNALAVDKEHHIYVGDSGATFTLDPESDGGTRQVVVFSPEGELLRRLGKAGGSPREGRFDPDGFGIITALAIGPDGNLWAQDVATGFKRTSRWSLEGSLQKQWFSRKIQHVADVINPAHPNEMLSARDAFDDSPPGLYAYEIDIAAKSWKPSWFYETSIDKAYRPAEGVFTSHQHPGNPLKNGHPERSWPMFDFAAPSFVTWQGRNYVLSGSGNGEGAIHMYSAGKAPQPVALVSYHRAEKSGGKIQGFYDNGPNNWFTWADRDNNGSMAMEETIFTEKPVLLENARRVSDARLTEGLNIQMKLLVVEKGNVRLMDAVLSPTEILANGAPVYDWSRLQESVQLQPPDFSGGDNSKAISSVWMPVPVETADAFYAILEPSAVKPLRLPGIDGEGWWAGRNWRKKLARFDKKTGETLWAAGRRAPARAQPGQMYNPIMLAGAAGNALFVADAMAVVWVWHNDGLYLGRLYNDTASGIADANSIYMEQQGTEIYTDPKTGKIFSIANDTGATIHEVKLPQITPLNAGTVTLGQDLLARVQPWDPDGVAPTEKPLFTMHPLGANVKVTVNGELDGREGWENLTNGTYRPEMQVLLDGERVAQVRAMYDDTNLYLGYEVQAPNGPVNSGSELPLGAFVSGAYVDFYLAPDWSGPRDEVREGDARIILARVKEGTGFTDFHRGFWQKKAGGANPQTITSPAAQIRFDEVGQVPGLKMACKVGDKNAKTGKTRYTVELLVPLASLGLNNPVGKTIGFDLSVGVANEAGDRRERAAHWAGLSEGVVVDRPGSARLLPSTWGTLRFAPAP
ncbi:MAG: hypothetical protein JWL59_3861 [Chthoniobacteraceae bacterium]|nr:hypothetical protein [Chthoniobacteraceae bacterium]